MKVRNTILLLAMAFETFMIFFCLLKKSNHVPVGYACAGVSLVLLVLTGWLLLFPKFENIPVTGEFKVKSEVAYYTDKSRKETYTNDDRNRELAVEFWSPENKENCPLIIFSHGAFGVRNSNISLYNELASHGYAVCAIDHTYQCFSTVLSDGSKVGMSNEFMKEMQTDNPHKNPEMSVVHWQKWMNIRTEDINFVLDTILEKSTKKSNELTVYSKINTDKIAVTGHSLGGAAALGIPRMRDDITAVIALESPFMCDITGVDENNSFTFSEEEFPVPALNIYSDSSWNHLTEWGQYKRNAELLNSTDEKFESVHIEGLRHIAMTDLSLLSPFMTSIFDMGYPDKPAEENLKEINRLCLEFLDKYMK